MSVDRQFPTIAEVQEQLRAAQPQKEVERTVAGLLFPGTPAQGAAVGQPLPAPSNLPSITAAGQSVPQPAVNSTTPGLPRPVPMPEQLQAWMGAAQEQRQQSWAPAVGQGLLNNLRNPRGGKQLGNRCQQCPRSSR